MAKKSNYQDVTVDLPVSLFKKLCSEVGEKNINKYVVEIVEDDLRRIEANSWMLSLSRIC
jgi:hypothetical protein